jgi:outer membrane protein, heavy metal efflux system
MTLPASTNSTSGLLLALSMACNASAFAQTAGTAPAYAVQAAAHSAYPAVSLADLIRTVVQNNPALLASQRSREASAASITSASALLNPKLELNAGTNRARLPSANGGAVSGWAVSQFIENPALREARISGARFSERSSTYQVAANTNELVAQVRLKAFEYLLRQEEAKAASEALTLLEQIRNRVKVRVESGEAARYEIIKADAEIINARQKVQTAYLQIDQVALGINRMAAGALPARWTLNATLSDAQEVTPLEDTKLSASQNNPELKALQAELDKREAALSETRAGRWPGIELRYNQLRDPEVRQGMLSASVQIPLLDQRRGPVAQASAELERARTLLDGRRAELTQQVLLAWKAMEMARVRVTALSTGAVREAEAALRVAEAAYRFGERGILDVLDAQRLLRSVRADLLDARYQVQAANVDLDYLAGRYADAYSPAATTLAP